MMSLEKNLPNNEYITNFGIAFVITALTSALLNVTKEILPDLKNFMKSIPPFYHHWATHGIFIISLFILLGLLFSYLGVHNKVKYSYDKLLYGILGATIIGSVLAGGYYLLHTFGYF